MLKLDYEQYDAAGEKMAKALQRAEDAGMRTFLGRALVMLEALGADFDVSVMDPGPERDDIKSGEVWGCEHCQSTLHSTEAHKSALSERIIRETAQYNRDVFGAK